MHNKLLSASREVRSASAMMMPLQGYLVGSCDLDYREETRRNVVWKIGKIMFIVYDLEKGKNANFNGHPKSIIFINSNPLCPLSLD